MKLTDKIHILQIDFEIELSPEKRLPRFVNCILLFGDRITLVDTGVKGSRILAHEAEKDWIEDIEFQNRQRPVPGFFNLVDTSVNIDEFLSDEQELEIENGLTLKVIHSPGHSKGSLNILFVENEILFTADSIPLKNDIPNYDNYKDLMKSLAIIEKNKQYKILLTSWTPPLMNSTMITSILSEGEEYMKQIDRAVKDFYIQNNADGQDACKSAVAQLGLPPFLAVPLVDKALRSHLIGFE